MERYFDPVGLLAGPNFTFGNLGRTLPDVRTPSQNNLDASIFKRFLQPRGRPSNSVRKPSTRRITLPGAIRARCDEQQQLRSDHVQMRVTCNAARAEIVVLIFSGGEWMQGSGYSCQEPFRLVAKDES